MHVWEQNMTCNFKCASFLWLKEWKSATAVIDVYASLGIFNKYFCLIVPFMFERTHYSDLGLSLQKMAPSEDCWS